MPLTHTGGTLHREATTRVVAKWEQVLQAAGLSGLLVLMLYLVNWTA